ncbi:serine/threonine-protein kinase [Fischerella sp. PCC 9605]|uniref:serine/threonine-protein kinase n=1 Tax=Fischerella sp. PCC 9605 TaxID=1173024 RepID=UPI00068615B5|nr:serine/threonine-protein kinase [Fischerella sp. PCC 9605]
MLLGTVLRNRYKILQQLGSGGFGDTYLAEDMDLPSHPKCVVKHLQTRNPNPEFLQIAKRLFNQEAEVLYRLGKRHDQIPELLAHFEENGEFYLVQEFVDGHDLTAEITPGIRLSEPQVVKLLQEILEVLAVVHEHNVIHRDIKLQNIMRRQDGKIVLIDFGSVKEIKNLATNIEGESTSTVVIGTPGYIPNEQANGKPRFCSDVYAVGMIGIQALTGIPPRKLPIDPNNGEVIWRNTANVSKKLADVLDNMVRYNFTQRYQTAADALQALEAPPPPPTIQQASPQREKAPHPPQTKKASYKPSRKSPSRSLRNQGFPTLGVLSVGIIFGVAVFAGRFFPLQFNTQENQPIKNTNPTVTDTKNQPSDLPSTPAVKRTKNYFTPSPTASPSKTPPQRPSNPPASTPSTPTTKETTRPFIPSLEEEIKPFTPPGEDDIKPSKTPGEDDIKPSKPPVEESTKPSTPAIEDDTKPSPSPAEEDKPSTPAIEDDTKPSPSPAEEDKPSTPAIEDDTKPSPPPAEEDKPSTPAIESETKPSPPPAEEDKPSTPAIESEKHPSLPLAEEDTKLSPPPAEDSRNQMMIVPSASPTVDANNQTTISPSASPTVDANNQMMVVPSASPTADANNPTTISPSASPTADPNNQTMVVPSAFSIEDPNNQPIIWPSTPAVKDLEDNNNQITVPSIPIDKDNNNQIVVPSIPVVEINNNQLTSSPFTPQPE